MNIDRADVAIFISALSFGVACSALGWNIFRELWLRPRLRVTLDIATISSEIMAPERKMVISGTNFGPGKIRVSIIHIRWKKASLFARFRRNVRQAVLIHDYKNPLSGQLPCTLDIGERVDLVFPFVRDSLLSQQPTRVGLRDYFGRDHWVPRKTLRAAQADYDKVFSAAGTEQIVGPERR
jgi:hypothetical protein